MVTKKTRFGQRKSKWERFNQPVEKSDFLKLFQVMLTEKMILMERGEFNREEWSRFMHRMGRPPQCIKVDTKEPIYLSCKIPPKFYLSVQDTCRRMFGKYMAMDELIKELLIYFVKNYGGDKFPKARPMFRRAFPGRAKTPQRLFDTQFSRFYRNHVVDFGEG